MLFKEIEEINVWREAIRLVKIVYSFSDKSRKFVKDYSLKDQVHRSAISIPSNIAEGFERGTKQEFIRFLFIAKASCGELRTQMYIASELGYITVEDFKMIESECRKISGMIMNLIKSLKGK